jgi:DNA-binding NtrC family response regulator
MTSRSVLIVDDDDDWRAVMADVLAEAGFFVTTACNGRAALTSWQHGRAEVVVTDVQMPVMDGCQLFAALQAIDRALPVIVLTAEGVSDVAPTFAGAFRIIRKPAPIEAVVSAVTDAVLRECPPGRGRIAEAAREIVSFGHAKGHAAMARAASLLHLRRNAERSLVRKRGRAGLAVAGLGAAAAVALLIATIRGLVA